MKLALQGNSITVVDYFRPYNYLDLDQCDPASVPIKSHDLAPTCIAASLITADSVLLSEAHVSEPHAD